MSEIQKEVTISLTSEEFIEGMDTEDVCEMLCAVAAKFTNSYEDRNKAARSFSDGLNEQTCRFLAEVVTHHMCRIPMRA